MDCAAEEQIVRLRLSELTGVHRVAVDLDARTVAVTHDHPADVVLAALDELALDSSLVDDPAAQAIAGDAPRDTRPQRSALLVALVINAGFFVVELAAGLLSGSMGLIADSLDMLADASVYALSLVAVGQAVAGQKRMARVSGYVQLGLAVLGLIEVLRRVVVGEPAPDPARRPHPRRNRHCDNRARRACGSGRTCRHRHPIAGYP
jgi:cation transport ATPase